MVFHLHKANRPPPHRPAALAASPGLHCSRQRRHSLSTSLASCLVAPDWNSYLEEFNAIERQASGQMIFSGEGKVPGKHIPEHLEHQNRLEQLQLVKLSIIFQ